MFHGTVCADINLSELGHIRSSEKSKINLDSYYYILDNKGNYVYHSLVGNTNQSLTIYEAEFGN